MCEIHGKCTYILKYAGMAAVLRGDGNREIAMRLVPEKLIVAFRDFRRQVPCEAFGFGIFHGNGDVLHGAAGGG